MIKRILLAVTLFVAPFAAFSQEEEEEDEKKMVREVVSVQVDRAKFAAPAPPPTTPDPKNKKKKKKVEEPPPELAPDTGNPLMPAPIGELVKRAHNYTKIKHPKYKKLN